MGRISKLPKKKAKKRKKRLSIYTEEDYLAALNAASKGMAVAVDHADDESPGWSHKAYVFAIDYCIRHEFVVFEDVIEESKQKGAVPHAPTDRAWGAVVRTLARDRIIVKEFSSYHRNPKSHGSLTHGWKSLIYKGRN